MKISPVSFNSFHRNQNFKGIMKYNSSNTEYYDSFETISTTTTYDYYPFKDESEKETKKIISQHKEKNTTTERYNHYPLYDHYYETSYYIHKPLSFTKEEYLLIKNSSEDTEVF